MFTEFHIYVLNKHLFKNKIVVPREKRCENQTPLPPHYGQFSKIKRPRFSVYLKEVVVERFNCILIKYWKGCNDSAENGVLVI